MAIIKGDIADIRFRNDDNGYTILTIDADGEPLVCVGSFPPVSEGESVELTGSFTVHAKYGKQFKVESVKNHEPDSPDSIIRFLGSKIIKGVGPKTALLIVSKFGDKTLSIMEFSPHRLAEVKGISPKKADSIGKAYQEVRGMREAVSFLQGLSVSLSLACKIYKVYGGDTISVVKTNPYILIETIDRVGFLTADKIAAKYGIGKESGFRLRAGIIYTLKNASEKNGDTFLPMALLLEEAAKLLEVSGDLILQSIEELLFDQKIKRVKPKALLKSEAVDDSPEGIMLASLYSVEKSSSARLSAMQNHKNYISIDDTNLIEEFSKKEKIELCENQVNAIRVATSGGVSVVTGGPGTGKTTIVKCILYIQSTRAKKVMLLAPTGRAAKRLQEQTGYTASTIHRALVSQVEGVFDANVVIVDEVSMVDIYLLNMLLNKLNPETELVLVGDKDQLPSVGAGNVLEDILKSKAFPIAQLSQVYRQQKGSLIVENAHKINLGKMPNLESKTEDFFFSECFSQEEIFSKTIALVTTRLPKYLNCEPSSIQVLTPMKKGIVGSISLNERLSQLINPKKEKNKEITEGDYKFREGDKVMHTANNYELEWVRYNSFSAGSSFVERGEGVFNGDSGIIEKIDSSTGEITVMLEDRRIVVYTRDLHSQLILSYAITIHKSQGSEFPACVIPLVPGNFMILTRNLLYTAVTRAKGLVVLVGSRGTIKKIVENDFIKKRYSMLEEFITEADRKNKILFNEINEANEK